MANESTAEMAEEAEIEETAVSKEKGTEPTAAELKAELERTKEFLKKSNNGAAKDRKRLEQLEKEEAERQKAALSDSEKAALKLKEAEEKAAKLESSLREERLRNAVELEATSLQFHYPADAFGMIADRLEDTDFDEDGKPSRKAIKLALKKLLEEKPKLAATDEDDSREVRRPPLTPKREATSRDSDSRGTKAQTESDLRSSGRYSQRM